MVRTVYLNNDYYMDGVFSKTGRLVQRVFTIVYERTGSAMRVIIFRELWIDGTKKDTSSQELNLKTTTGLYPKSLARQKALTYIKKTYPEITKVTPAQLKQMGKR